MTLTQRQPSPLSRRLSIAVSEVEADTHPPSIISESPTSIPHHRLITPVPYLKLFPLLIQRWSEGVTYGVIFPYINEMIHSMGVEEKSVGVWSATAVSYMFS